MQDYTLRLRKTIEELNRVTGLSLHISQEEMNNPEQASFTLEQLTSLLQAYKEKNDAHSLMKRWILGDMDTQELLHSAKRLHIEPKGTRALLLIESRREIDDTVLSILTNSFPDQINYWFIPVTLYQVAMVVTFFKKAEESDLQELAYLVMDILNGEAMMRVKIAHSSFTENLNQLADAYRETTLALQVCNIFYPEQHVYAYNRLGIGRLVYGLSKEQCITYMTESLGPDYAEILQPETCHTFNCFFDNNLNIAETARQLHMHRNTFIYRLEQIQKHTGLDVRQFHDAMTFKTSLLVMNYLNTLE